ncbi:pilus assembly protein [Corticibacter populi]|uniref:Pilus assembly protein n=1 Tax=Corticibacter populi TaxID=1550736 RepID=A0A3M6QPB0_9BURK|nr:TadE family protein [Corticibacter populi]RMX04877.1 pilus assembly protein [Corticibacter populi]RZS33699.1 TadE-like protein [Corticibacter populi]
MSGYSCPASSQRGQATAEFIVALLVMIPLFMGVYYLARYADVKHSAIQASRYVAFERTWDPAGKVKSAQQLADETRARFFLPVSRNDGVISHKDSVANANPSSHRIPLWSDLTYQPLLARFSDVAIKEVPAGQLNSGLVGALQDKLAKPVFRLPDSGVMRAEVTVSLADVAHYEVLRNIQVGLPAATAIGAGAWNASGANVGSDSVCQRIKPAVLTTYTEPAVSVLGALMVPFEKYRPEGNLTKPDYAPPGSVRTHPGDQNRSYPQQNGNKC